MRFVQETFKLGKWKLLTRRVKGRKEKKKMVSISHRQRFCELERKQRRPTWLEVSALISKLRVCVQSHKEIRKTLPKSTETQSMTMQAHIRLVPTYQQEEWTAERLTIHRGKVTLGNHIHRISSLNISDH